MAKSKRKRALGHTAILKTAYTRHQQHHKKKHASLQQTKSQSAPAISQQSPVKQNQKGSPIPQRPLTQLAAGVSILVGISIAMLSVGLYTQYVSIFVDMEQAARTILGMALIALAAGIRLPQRFTMWLYTKAWHQFVRRGQPTAQAEIMINPARADRPLYWAALAAVTLTSGLLAIALPWVLGQSLVLHRFLLDHFVWSDPAIVVLHTVVTSFSIAIPFCILGIGVSFVHRLSCPFGRWDTRATAWLLLGSGIGTIAALSLRMAIPQHHIILIASALPTLIAAVIAILASAKEPITSSQYPEPTPRLPLTSDRRPRLLRVAIVAVGVVGVCAMSIFSSSASQTSSGWMMALFLIVMGLGVLTECTLRPIEKRTMGGFGTVCISAGAMFGCWAITFSMGWLTQGKFTLIFLCACIAAIGFAKAYGRQALLQRVAIRTSTGATILARIIVFSAGTICIGVPLMMRSFDQSTAISVLALSLLSIGTAMVMYEQAYRSQARLRRLAVACIMTLCILASIRFYSGQPQSDFYPGRLNSQNKTASALPHRG